MFMTNRGVSVTTERLRQPQEDLGAIPRNVTQETEHVDDTVKNMLIMACC